MAVLFSRKSLAVLFVPQKFTLQSETISELKHAVVKTIENLVHDTLNDWEKPLDKEEKFFLVNGIIGKASAVTPHLDDLATMEFQADFMDEIDP